MIPFLARQKFRFDLGVSFMMIVNLTLLAISAGDKIYSVTGIATRYSVPSVVVLAIAGVWTLGYGLDKAKFQDAYQDEQNKRNKMLTDALRDKQ